MKNKLARTLVLLAATCGLQAFAATPVAVWDGDFTTATKGAWTLSSTGSTITDASITIGTTPITLVHSSTDANKYKTVIYKVTGLDKTTVGSLATFGRTDSSYNGTDLMGAYLETDKVWGVWAGAKRTNTPVTQVTPTKLTSDKTVEHTIVVRYASGDASGITAFIDGEKVFVADSSLKGTMNNFNRYTILGFYYNNAALIAKAVVTKVAIFSDSTDAGDAAYLNYAFPSELVPVAVWDGDFKSATKGDWTLNAGSSTVASDGSFMMTAGDTLPVIRRNAPMTTKPVTVIVRYDSITLNGQSGNNDVYTGFSFDGVGGDYTVTGADPESPDVFGMSLRGDGKGCVMVKGVYTSASQFTTGDARTGKRLGITLADATNGTTINTLIDNASVNSSTQTGTTYGSANFRPQVVKLGTSTKRQSTGVQHKNLTGWKITGVAIFAAALTAEEQAAFKFPTDQFKANAHWGNIGDAESGGIATNLDRTEAANTSFNLNFGETSNICTKEIGSNGRVRITKIRLAARSPNGSTITSIPPSITLTQGGLTTTSTSLDSSTDMTIYKASGTDTRKCLLYTFPGDVLFDAATQITMSLANEATGGKGGCTVMKPKNTTMCTGDWSPVVELIGDYYGGYTPSEMYFNRLAGLAKVPSGKYGEITVGGDGIAATTFASRTTLSNTPTAREIGGSYADVIKDGTDIATHTFAGWFKVGELPTGDAITMLYHARSQETSANDNGYGVAVTSAGAIKVGKTNQEAFADGLLTTTAPITANTWFHLAVSVTKTASARTATPVVYVNGIRVPMASGTFATNLGGNSCVGVDIGAGVSAAGIYIDNGALDNPYGIRTLATDTRYVAPICQASVNEDVTWNDLWPGTPPPAGAVVVLNVKESATLTFGSTATLCKMTVNTDDGKVLSISGQNNLAADELNIPQGSRVDLKSNAALAATKVTGAGTLAYDPGSVNNPTVLEAGKLADFTGTFWMKSGRHTYSSPIASGVTLKVTHGAQFWADGGSWDNAFELSGQGWQQTSGGNDVEYAAMRLDGELTSAAQVTFENVDNRVPTLGTTEDDDAKGKIAATLKGCGFEKRGTGRIILTQPKTQAVALTDDIIVTKGTLQVGTNDGFSANDTVQLGTGDLVVNADATLTIRCWSGSDVSTGVAGKVKIANDITVNDGGTLKTQDGAYAFTGTVTANGTASGNLRWRKGWVFSNLIIPSGATFNVGLNESEDRNLYFSVLGGQVDGTLNLTNAGTVTSNEMRIGLAGTAFANGVLNVTSANQATYLFLVGDTTIKTVTGNVSAAFGDGTLRTMTLAGGTYGFSFKGIDSGTSQKDKLNLVVAGDTTLNGSGTYSSCTGTLTLRAGVLATGNATAIPSGTLRKTGAGEATIAANAIGKNNKPTGIVVEEGTLRLGTAGTLFFNGGTENAAVPLTVTGGTLDLSNAFTWNTTDGSGWLTQKPITLGGATESRVIGGSVTFYENNIPSGNAIIYLGNNGSNAAAEFATSWHGSYSHSKDYPRNILVEKGAGEEYDLLISGTFGLFGGDYSSTKITKTGAGTVCMTGAFNFPYLTVSAGTWKMGSNKALAANTTIGDNGTLDLNGFSLTNVVLSGAGIVTNTSDKAVEIVSKGRTVDLSTARIGNNITLKVSGADVVAGIRPFILPAATYGRVQFEGGLPDMLTYDLETGVFLFKSDCKLGDDLIWLPVGDSITEGEKYMGHPEKTTSSDDLGGYRYQLWNDLEQGGQQTRSVGYRTGHGGAANSGDAQYVEDPSTCRWAWHAAQYGGVIMHDAIGYPSTNPNHGSAGLDVENVLQVSGYPDLITVLIGVNDLSFVKPADGYEKVFTTWQNMIVKYAEQRPHTKIVVSTLLPAGGNRMNYIAPFNAFIRNAYNASPKQAPFDHDNVVFADVALLAFNNAPIAEYCKGDTLHPNLEGAKVVAKAWTSVIQGQVAELAKAKAVPVQIHNGTAGKVSVRFSKKIASVTAATLTITGTDVEGVAREWTFSSPAVKSGDVRVVEFDVGDQELLGGTYAATLTNVSATDGNGIALEASYVMTDSQFVEILGTGGEKNVPNAYRKGFEKYQTVEIANSVNYGGNGPSAATKVLKGDAITRVGYYVELQRADQPAQFVWVSMSAEAFSYKTNNVGVPTTAVGNIRQRVSHLQVYGNHGNFTNTETNDTAQTGIVEFSPWTATATDQSGFPTEFKSNHFGWNDTLGDSSSGLKGCMQVARATGVSPTDDYTQLAGEMVFAFNNFNCATATDIGIGTFSTHRNNGGATISPVTDWTDFASQSGFAKFQDSAYAVKKIEIWVLPLNEYSATIDGNANWSQVNWTPVSGGTAVPSAQLPGGCVLKLDVRGDYTLTMDVAADVGELVVTNTAGAASLAITTTASGVAIDKYILSPTLTAFATDLPWTQAYEIPVAQTLTIAVKEGEDYALAQVLSGGGKLVKAGAGMLTLDAANTLTGGIDIEAGTIKLGGDSVLGTGTTDVKDGATIDMNGKKPTNVISLAGDGVDGEGALVTSVNMSSSINTQIRLTADASWGGSAYYHFGANSDVQLNGFTFTKRGSNVFPLNNTTVHGPGTIKVVEGTFDNNAGNNTLDRIHLDIEEGATLSMRGTSLSVSNFVCKGAISDTTATLKVNGMFDGANSADVGALKIQLVGNGVASVGTKHGFTLLGAGSVDAKLTDAEAVAGTTTKLFTRGSGATTTVGNVYDPTGVLIPSDCYTVSQDGMSITLKREAKIGTTYYFTLQKALNAATEGQTVTLCTNVTMTAAYELDKSITLDGDIYEITGEGFTGSGKLTIAGGFIGVTTLPGSRSLVGGKYKNSDWTSETGYHYADMASSEITGYAKQIIAGSGQAGEKAYPITDGGETYQGDLAFTKDELVQKGIVTSEATDLQIAEALNTSGANGRPTWENVVLGLRNDDALAKPVPTPVQTDAPGKIKLRLDNLNVSTTSGAKITYKVTTTTGGVETTKTAEGVEAEFDLPQSGVSYYKFEVTATPAK